MPRDLSPIRRYPIHKWLTMTALALVTTLGAVTVTAQSHHGLDSNTLFASFFEAPAPMTSAGLTVQPLSSSPVNPCLTCESGFMGTGYSLADFLMLCDGSANASYCIYVLMGIDHFPGGLVGDCQECLTCGSSDPLEAF